MSVSNSVTILLLCALIIRASIGVGFLPPLAYLQIIAGSIPVSREKDDCFFPVFSKYSDNFITYPLKNSIDRVQGLL